MSDFLDNLIARNNGNARARADASVNAIRPYLPSRFEPSASGEPALDFADATDFETTVETTAPARTSPVGHQHDEQLVPTTPVVNRRREDALAEPQRATREHDSSSTEVHAAPLNEPAPVPRAAEPASNETLVERVVLVEREIERPAERPAAPSRRRDDYGIPPSTLLVVERQRESDTRDADEPRGVASPDETTTLLAPADSARGRDEEMFSTTRSEARRNANAPQQSPAARPTSGPDIHVTIGRVEVRAAAPPSTKPARRNAPQPMTLDEYLRRRASGEHR